MKNEQAMNDIVQDSNIAALPREPSPRDDEKFKAENQWKVSIFISNSIRMQNNWTLRANENGISFVWEKEDGKDSK